MLVRALATAVFLASTSLPAAAVTPVAATAEARQPMTTAELMTATALDQVFTAFAETIASSPEQQGVPLPADLARSWKETSYAVFQADEMQAALAAAFEGRFSDAELGDLGVFYRSDFGHRITALETAIQVMSADEQLAARDEGIAIIEDLDAGSRRFQQIEEIMVLVSADVSQAMIGQGLRAMMASMAIAGARGDVQVPWDEIDAQVESMLPGLREEVAATQRALMAYAYRDLDDDELERYVEFLRTEPARKFYALVGYSVGAIMEQRMSQFGEELAHRLNRVNV